MFTKLDNLIKNIFSESSDQESKSLIYKYDTNEFYNKFIRPLLNGENFTVVKESNNRFLAYGTVEEISNFFKKLKVNETFMKNPDEFLVFSPAFSFGDENYALNLNLDQYYYPEEKNGALTKHDLANITRKTPQGNWFLFTSTDGYFPIKSISPSDLSVKLLEYFKDVKTDSIKIYVEFKVNVERLANSIWDEMSEYGRTADDLNELLNSESDDFDYSLLNLKK